MTLDEAVRILNVPVPKSDATTEAAAKELEHVVERFKRLFDQNEPGKGGSFYLQSKILRARERLEGEIGDKVRRAEEEVERKRMPKMYKSK